MEQNEVGVGVGPRPRAFPCGASFPPFPDPSPLTPPPHPHHSPLFAAQVQAVPGGQGHPGSLFCEVQAATLLWGNAAPGLLQQALRRGQRDRTVWQPSLYPSATTVSAQGGCVDDLLSMWARGHEAEREGLLRDIMRRGVATGMMGGRVGVWTEPPSSGGVSPSSAPHRRAVAARLAGRPVLAELMAQVCGAEPSTGGPTGLELKGRCAAVLCGGAEAAGGTPRDTLHPPKPGAHSTRSPQGPLGSPCKRTNLSPCCPKDWLVSSHRAPTQPLWVPLGRVMTVGPRRGRDLWGARGLAGTPGVGGWDTGGWLPQEVDKTFCAGRSYQWTKPAAPKWGNHSGAGRGE